MCFFAHWDADDVVDPVVHHYLDRLRALGFGIVFVSSSALPEAQTAPLKEICAAVDLRPNGGLDFGSWSYAIDRYGCDVDGDLLLTNDSVYGPIGDLSGTLGAFDLAGTDFFGLVESHEVTPHLQSWFLLFRKRVHASSTFREVFSQPFHSMGRRAIIRDGEIRLTRALQEAGFSYAAAYSPRRSFTHPRLFRANPCFVLWRHMPGSGVPFIKARALRDARFSDHQAYPWSDIVEPLDPGLSQAIGEHLARTAGRLQPRGWLASKLLRWAEQILIRGIEGTGEQNRKLGILRVFLFLAIHRTGLLLSWIHRLRQG